MKKFALALAACSVIASGASYAQTAVPAPAAKTMSVPKDAELTKNLIGLDVYDGANDNVGAIKDLVIDKGTLAGYILSVGGFLGMGEHYVAVTPQSVGLMYNTTDKKWKASINITKDQLKAAPQFTYSGRFNNE